MQEPPSYLNSHIIAAILPSPSKKVIQQVEDLIVNFINSSKRHIVPRKLIFTPKEEAGLGIPPLRDFWNSIALSWTKRSTSSKSFWLALLSEKVATHPNLTFLSSSYHILNFSPSVKKNSFWTTLLERWKKIMDPILLADKFRLITQNVHLNPLLTHLPIKITNSPDFTPLYTILSPNYFLLSLNTLLHRIPGCALNFVTYQTLKGKISPILALIRHEYYTSKSKSNLVKPEMYLPAPPSYSYNFLLTLKKGCKHFRKLMPYNLYNQSDWKCFEHHQTKI